MKNFLLLLLFMLAVVIFMGCFTLNENEDAVLTSNIYHSKYYTKPGIYFALPFLYKVNIIYKNDRKIFLTWTIPTESAIPSSLAPQSVTPHDNINVSVWVNWHVVDSKVYLNNIETEGTIELNKRLAGYIYNVVITKATSMPFSDFNRLDNLLDKEFVINPLGIAIDQINIAMVERNE